MAELWIAGKVNLSASTASRYRSALDVHILPEFETKPIADLTRERLRKWVSKMVENSSAATVRKNVGVLSQILDQAVQDSRLVSNPAAGLDLPKLEHEERRYLTVHQVDLLAKAADKNALFVYVLAYCGLRFGEAAALTIADVNLERRRLHIHRSATVVDSKIVVSSTKSNQARDVRCLASSSTCCASGSKGAPPMPWSSRTLVAAIFGPGTCAGGGGTRP
ncbi:tyrosine-type recombinase/integrase [Rhodococcus hoagii]|nr:tyrosine-type recombinase/integrase [Prescottella equi]